MLVQVLQWFSQKLNSLTCANAVDLLLDLVRNSRNGGSIYFTLTTLNFRRNNTVKAKAIKAGDPGCAITRSVFLGRGKKSHSCLLWHGTRLHHKECACDCVYVCICVHVSVRVFVIDGRGDWTPEGCETIDDGTGVIQCNCTHLTNFAVLVVSLNFTYVIHPLPLLQIN